MGADGARTWAEVAAANPTRESPAMSDPIRPADISREDRTPLAHLENADLMPLPAPLDDPAREPRVDAALRLRRGNGTRRAWTTPAPSACPSRRSKQEEDELVRTLPLGARQALHAREQLDLPPAARADDGALREVPDVLRRLPHLRGERTQRDLSPDLPLRDHAPALLQARPARAACCRRGSTADIKLNWPLVARLVELAYRCNLCRRCAQTCPIGADNGLVAHELRKLFSQEMGIAPKELPRQRLDAPAQGRLLDRHDAAGRQGQHRVHRRGHDREDGHRGRDAVGRRGRRRPAHPQRRRDPGLAREPRRVRRHPQRRRHQLDALLRARGLRLDQLRRSGTTTRSSREWRCKHAEAARKLEGEEDRARRVRTRAQGADRHRRPGPHGRLQHPARELA